MFREAVQEPRAAGSGGWQRARDDGLEMHAAAKSGREVISFVFVRRVGERHRRATHARPDLLFSYLFISPQLSLMFQSAE